MMGAFGNADSHAGMAGGSGMSALASRPFHVPTDEEVVRAFLLFLLFLLFVKASASSYTLTHLTLFTVSFARGGEAAACRRPRTTQENASRG